MSRQRFVAPGFELVAKVFDKYHSADKAGASFAAMHRGVQVVDVWGGVRADGEPWTDETICIIASGTKGICAVAILMLVERGLLDLEAPIESVWPEFAEGGKGHVSIGDSLAHVAGVPGLERSISVEEIQDPVLMARYVAAQHPITPIGVPSYHATTYGWIASELLRRVDGRSIGAFVREEIAAPLQLDMHIGVPSSEMHRVGEITRSNNYNYSAMIGDDVDPRLQYVYGLVPPERGSLMFAKSEFPGGGGIANALAMSRLYAMLVNGGELDGVRLLKPETIEIARRQRSVGNDPLSGRLLRFGVGFELNPNPSRLGMDQLAFGHTGAGGSTHGAWPSMQGSFSYAMREFQSENADSRGIELLDVLDECMSKAG
jgi:CubicO group peptidase (beta-lactamase class C family)